MIRLSTKADRLAARYKPPTYTAVVETAACAVYIGDSPTAARPHYSAIGYRGTAGRSTFHYSFKTAAQRDQYVADFIRSIDEAAARRQTRSAERSSWINPLKVGDILYTSWWYDQTNVDFYVVQRVSGRAIDLAPIASSIEGTGFMSGRATADQPVKVTGEPMRKIVQPGFEGKPTVSLTTYSSATLWDGQPKHCSWYA